MGVTDWGEINQPLGAPALGGAGGWADSVAQALNNSDETVDARLATLEAALEALINGRVAKTGDTMTGDLNLPTQTSAATLGDKISLYDRRLNLTSCYGLGVEASGASTLYFKSPYSHRWYSGANADGGASDIMELRPNGLTIPEGSTATDAATKGYVDDKVAKTGDTMTGDLIFNGTTAYNQVWFRRNDVNRFGIRQYTDDVIDGSVDFNMRDDAGNSLSTIRYDRPTGVFRYVSTQQNPVHDGDLTPKRYVDTLAVAAFNAGRVDAGLPTLSDAEARTRLGIEGE